MLRIADAEVLDRSQTHRSSPMNMARRKSVGQCERARRAVLGGQALRKRILLRHLQHDSLIHRGVGIDAVTRRGSPGRCGNRPPGDADPRLETCFLLGPDQRRRIMPPVTDPRDRCPAPALRREPVRDIEIHQAAEQLRDRRAVVPTRARIDGQDRQTRQSSVKYASTPVSRKYLSALP
jgi:hypothetical protein